MERREELFQKTEEKFQGMSEIEIADLAIHSLKKVIEGLGKDKTALILGLMVTGAKIGVYADQEVKEKEQQLMDAVFGIACTGAVDDLCRDVKTEITEADYAAVESVTGLGDQTAMAYLDYILCFAYIDGILEEEVRNRLIRIYGALLMKKDFFHERSM